MRARLSKHALAALALTALLSACGPAPGGDNLPAIEGKMARKEYAAAVIDLKNYLAKTPNSGKARYLLGLGLMEQGQFVGALTEFNKALELNFDDEAVQGKHAKTLLANGRYQEVLKSYDQILLKDAAANAEVRTAVAVAHARFDRIDQAERALDEALVGQPNYGWALVTKARIALSRGDDVGATRLVDQAIAAQDIHGEAWHLRGAMLQVLRKDLAGAEKAYKEAIKDKRYAAMANNALIALYITQNRVADLKALHESMRKVNPEAPATILVDAQVAYLEGKLDRAREDLDKLLRVMPNESRLLVFSGGVDFRRGALLRAETQLGKALQNVELAPIARQMLAQTYLRMAQPEKAMGALRPLLETNRTGAEVLALAGEASLQLGQVQKAEGYFNAAVKLRPDDPRLRTAVALTELARGRVEDGLEVLRKVALSDPGDTADKALISAHMRRREYHLALGALERLEKKRPGTMDVVLHRGMILRAKGDLNGARAAFESILKHDASNYMAAANLAEIDLSAGDRDGARRRLTAAVAANPKSPGPRLTLATFLSFHGKPDEVKSTLTEAIAVIPGDSMLRTALVTHLLVRRDPNAALVVAQQSAATFPEQIEVLDALGRAQADVGDDQQALSTFGRMANLAAANPLPHLRLADIHGKRKDMQAASRSLRKAFDLAPTSVEVHVRMLALARITKDPKLVLGVAKELQVRFPGSAVGYFLEGEAERGRANWTGAIAAFRSAIGKPDARSEPQARIYDTLTASGQGASADRFAADWLKTRATDYGFISHIAGRAIQRRQYGEAERLLSQVVAAEPTASALNNLAWLQAERGLKSAVETAERALALAPAAPAVLDTLAKALAVQQKWPRAIEVQQRAVAGSNGDPAYRLSLARLYASAGDRVKAKVELDALAALGDTFTQQAAVASLLKSIAAQ